MPSLQLYGEISFYAQIPLMGLSCFFLLRSLFRDGTAKISQLRPPEGHYMPPFLLHDPTFSCPCMFYAAFCFIWPNDVVMGASVRFNIPSDLWRDSF